MARGEGEGEEFERVNGCTVSYVDVNYGFIYLSIYLSIYSATYVDTPVTYVPGTTPIAVYTSLPPGLRLTAYRIGSWGGVRPSGV